MDLKECISFARENPLCSLATAEDTQPHVRTVRLDQADDTGFYFTLGMTKKMYRQLCKNPRIELCFFHPDQDFSQVKQMRVTGLLEEIHDPVMLEKGYEARKGLEPLVGKPIKPLLATFRLNSGEVHFWTFMNALKEDQIEVLQF